MGSALSVLVERCSFPPPGSQLRIGVSGGADSMALLALATEAGLDVEVVHVDHGLRSDGASEAALVHEAAERFGASFKLSKIDVADGPNLEERARIARHEALGPGAATGHTMDDRAETVLINLLRGAGLDGLSAMRPGPRHPILALRRSQTHSVCKQLGIKVVIDPSNEDPRFVRNRVRHELIPLLNDVAHRDLVPVLTRQAELMAHDSDFLNAAAEHLDPTDAKELAAASPVLASRSVRAWLRSVGTGHPPDGATLGRVLAVAAGERQATEIPGGYRVSRSGQRLSLSPPVEE